VPRALGSKPELCDRIGVRAYPTWIVEGQRHEGVMSLDQLADASRFPGPRSR
jgi:hypothetical protein